MKSSLVFTKNFCDCVLGCWYICKKECPNQTEIKDGVGLTNPVSPLHSSFWYSCADSRIGS